MGNTEQKPSYSEFEINLIKEIHVENRRGSDKTKCQEVMVH